MTLVRMVTVVAALVLATGCGSESSPDTAEPTKAPKNYSIADLKAALPAKDDVPDSLQMKHVCPGDDDYCTPVNEGESVSTDIELIPAGAESPAEMEEAAAESVTADSVGVDAWSHESADLATKSVELTRAANEEFEGAYDVKQVKDGKFITPAENGTGTVKKLSVDGWKGVIGSRTGSFAFDGDSMQRQFTLLRVSNGRTSVTVHVTAEDKERPADYADKLARRLLADYLKKLG